MARSALLDPCEEEAIAWMVEMRSGAAGGPQREALAQWLSADARHRQAWQRLGGALDATFGSGKALAPLAEGGRAQAVGATLDQARARAGQRRRMLRGALGVAGIGAGSAWIAQGSGLVPDWRADLHTATGERRSQLLADGSRLDLDARTSVDIAFRADARLLRLRQGQILVDAVRQPAGAPFTVEGLHGQVRTPGARFMLRQQEERTLAVALTQGLALRSGAQHAQLAQGESAYLDGRTISAAAQGSMADAAAWVRGMLHADNMALGEVLAALKPYRLGFLRVSPAAAQLRVTGVYGLDDSDATLQALAETLPIAVHRHPGGWLVRIDLAS